MAAGDLYSVYCTSFLMYSSTDCRMYLSHVYLGSWPSLFFVHLPCQGISRPDCVITARLVFDSSLYDPLSITSLYGSEAILRKMLENSDLTKTSSSQIKQLWRLLVGYSSGVAYQGSGFFSWTIKSVISYKYLLFSTAHKNMTWFYIKRATELFT